MLRNEFSPLLRDALANIFDFAVLEKHPINGLLPQPKPPLRRSENLRQFIWEGIERLKPDEESRKKDTLEWRYYAILSGRYIEGESVLEIQRRLALGERQERRLHSRALGLLENILWQQIASAEDISIEPPKADSENEVDFPLQLEQLSLGRVLQEAVGLYAGRDPGGRVELLLHIPESLPPIRADRVILRLILLDLLNRLWPLCADGCIQAHAQPVAGWVRLEFNGRVGQEAGQFQHNFWAQSQVGYWMERLKGKITLDCESGGPAECFFRFLLEFPQAAQTVFLVVDDHTAAIRIIERYLNQTNISVIGVTNSSQVLPQARQMRPQGILLDVMMPNTDGWEVLQGLKSDPDLSAIPVVVCSVWNQPDLAFSLGANGFLKKPISQANLQQELTRLNLWGIVGGSPEANSPTPG